MSLCTEFGRYSRAAVTERAKAIYAGGGTWQAARAQAHREAADELRETKIIAIDMEHARA